MAPDALSTGCNLVSPRWVRIGSVKWHGEAERRDNYMLEYERCDSPATATKAWKGLTLRLCPTHAAETFTTTPTGGTEP